MIKSQISNGKEFEWERFTQRHMTGIRAANTNGKQR